jgi:hypothetical protein
LLAGLAIRCICGAAVVTGIVLAVLAYYRWIGPENLD